MNRSNVQGTLENMFPIEAATSVPIKLLPIFNKNGLESRVFVVGIVSGTPSDTCTQTKTWAYGAIVIDVGAALTTAGVSRCVQSTITAAATWTAL